MEYVTRQMQTYKTGNAVMDQFYIDDDYNVPDAKSDVKKGVGQAEFQDSLRDRRGRDQAVQPGRKDPLRRDDLSGAGGGRAILCPVFQRRSDGYRDPFPEAEY